MAGVRNEKISIREKMLEARMSVPTEDRELANNEISKRISSLASFRFADTVLLYSPIKAEPELSKLIEIALKAGKRIAYPKCNPENSTMTYRFVGSPDELVAGEYGILEPSESCGEYIPSPDKHDICIVPAVCYDRDGYRVGYGKGYYDRYLSRFGGTAVGCTMERFLFDKLPRGKFDKKVDIVVTEKRIIMSR